MDIPISHPRSSSRFGIIGHHRLGSIAVLAATFACSESIPSSAEPTTIVSTAADPLAEGKFQPTWESLKQYRVREWFRDAKFGIWAHWRPQCEPGMGDWYARHLYFEDGPAWGPNVTACHREKYGHPSQAGFVDGKGTWWESLDSQNFYGQRHAPAPGFDDLKSIHNRWEWGNGITPPDLANCQKFYNRAIGLINRCQPDLIYFDDTALPLWPVSDAGLKIAAHFYNRNDQLHGNDGVLIGKILSEEQRQCMAWDIERGTTNVIEPHRWQTDTCIGSWHHQLSIFEQHGYKSARTVVQTLIDVVSKNGNLLLNIPLRGDGTPDDDELAIIEGIAGWMQVKQVAIHGTRPWKILGEGPQTAENRPLQGSRFNEGKGEAFTAEDVRFTTKDGTLYAFVMGAPQSAVRLKSLGTAAELFDTKISGVTLLGSTAKLQWSQSEDALTIELPPGPLNEIAVVFSVSTK